jgi:hypothetical protein
MYNSDKIMVVPWHVHLCGKTRGHRTSKQGVWGSNPCTNEKWKTRQEMKRSSKPNLHNPFSHAQTQSLKKKKRLTAIIAIEQVSIQQNCHSQTLPSRNYKICQNLWKFIPYIQPTFPYTVVYSQQISLSKV